MELSARRLAGFLTAGEAIGELIGHDHEVAVALKVYALTNEPSALRIALKAIEALPEDQRAGLARYFGES